MTYPGRVKRLVGVLALLLSISSNAAASDVPPFDAIGLEYQGKIRPLMKRFCYECHATDDPDGELDLERFVTVDDVRRTPKTWVKVAEMLDNGEMPPQDAEKPSDAQRKQLRGWVEHYLKAEALASAGDPGPVVLRRLSNAQYTYTIQDLTRLDLQPAREFPADGAAGEGFTNTGNALVMSPALLSKYLDAGKGVAEHSAFLPDGLRFMRGTTRRDWTNQLLDEIRGFYARYTDSGGGTQVNLQGIIFGTNDGGRLPLEKYLQVTIKERQAITSGAKSVADVARDESLSAKYLGTLWETLHGSDSTPIFEQLRERWRVAAIKDIPELVKMIGEWQRPLWKFGSVGHIGKLNGPKAWMEPVSPLVSRQDLRLKVPSGSGDFVSLFLTAGSAGDGDANDFVVWERPRLVALGRPDLLLRDVRSVAGELTALRDQAFAVAAKCLDAATDLESAGKGVSLEDVARQHGVTPEILGAWVDYLGIGTNGTPLKIEGVFPKPLMKIGGYDFANGWGAPETPNVAANSSGRDVRIPGNLRPHGVVMHPSPSLSVAAGWLSPIRGSVRVEGRVRHAHPECGNGVTWALELRRGGTRMRLAAGVAQGAKEQVVGPVDNLAIQTGDLISLIIGPRDGNHACDLTAVDLTLTCDEREWDLSREVSSDILAGNPHADAHGVPGVWHFYAEPDRSSSGDSVIPAGSFLARWQSTTDVAEKERLARELQGWLTAGPPKTAAKEAPDRLLYRRLASLRGPLVAAMRRRIPAGPASPDQNLSTIGIDPERFGKHPQGQAIDPFSLCVKAPNVLEIRLPADLVTDCEFVTGGVLESTTGAEGSVQLKVTTNPEPLKGTSPDLPVLVHQGSSAMKRFEKAFETMREVFPPALCYTKIVPVDEVVTLTLFYREDDRLRRLMLDVAQSVELDRLWDELRFISQDALTLVDAYAQLMEYATQDADPKVFEPLRKPIQDRAAAFRKALLDAEPKHVGAVLRLAAQAYRRPLREEESAGLRALYQLLRREDLPHDEALRLTIARMFVAPAFLYRMEKAGAGDKPSPVTDWELASRLSYFLWSSMPDEELQRLAASGRLHEPGVLAEQAGRMLRDPKVRRLAVEFACQWLHIYEFDTLDEKSERHFPTFAALRGDMYEESIRFFTDLFQSEGSVLAIFDADHSFLNDRLAKHYGISGVSGGDWRRVEGMKKEGRGGILGLSSTLAKQAGASRTSPILRGNWVSEVLLGERLPRPPKDVPKLPEDETSLGGLTVRQLVEKHTSDIRCAGCHARIDPMGFALEGFDAIGGRRRKDLGSLPIDTHAKLQDGTEFDGIEGLRRYLLTTRREAVLRQFDRKLLGYALGRGVQLSDGPLLDEVRRNLEQDDYRFSKAVETIVRSRQFREIRGKDATVSDVP